jgi:hypothetical protein
VCLLSAPDNGINKIEITEYGSTKENENSISLNYIEQAGENAPEDAYGNRCSGPMDLCSESNIVKSEFVEDKITTLELEEPDSPASKETKDVCANASTITSVPEPQSEANEVELIGDKVDIAEDLIPLASDKTEDTIDSLSASSSASFSNTSTANTDITIGNDNKIENNNLPSEVLAMDMETKDEGENGNKDMPMKPTTVIRAPIRLCEAYNNMFLIFYGLPPNISTGSIEIALRQCEELLHLADHFGALPIVRQRVKMLFDGYDQQLLISIKDHPIRWLKASITLQSVPIFKEAVIHVVGTYPSWYQNTSALSSLPPEVQELIRHKWDTLHRSLDCANSLLLRATIVLTQKNIPVSLEYKDTFESWMVVQIWRDWLASRLRVICENPTAEAAGQFYLLLAGPSYAYFTVENVQALLAHVQGDGFGAFASLAEDLELLKSYARSVVEDICVNNCGLDVAAEGIGHLTCTDVSSDEIPWLTPEL